MAMFPIDRNNRIPSLKAALQSAGVLTTVFFESATELVVKTTRSNKILRFPNWAGVYIGSAWISGTNLTNLQSVDASGITPDPFDWNLVITPDVMAFVYKGGTAATGRCNATIFTTTADGARNLVLAFTSDGGAFSDTFSYDTTVTADVSPVIVPSSNYSNGILIDGNGFYFTVDTYWKNLNGNQLIASPAKGFKAIMNGTDNTSAFFKFGNDIVANGWYTNDALNLLAANILIPNAVI